MYLEPGPLIQKVIDATAIARKLRPDLLIEGPLQVCPLKINTCRPCLLRLLHSRMSPISCKKQLLRQ